MYQSACFTRNKTNPILYKTQNIKLKFKQNNNYTSENNI